MSLVEEPPRRWRVYTNGIDAVLRHLLEVVRNLHALREWLVRAVVAERAVGNPLEPEFFTRERKKFAVCLDSHRGKRVRAFRCPRGGGRRATDGSGGPGG